jgi:dsDNA-specific endonuclease/ATPase MutS2
MENVVSGPVLDEVLTGIKRQAAQLEVSKQQLEQHVRSLGGDRDRVAAELEGAQKELAGVKQKQKEADAIASRTKQEAQAEAQATLAAARQEAKNLLDAVRVRIASAQRVLGAK